ncbi:MAG: hypothetical protein WC162_06945 [Sphaerochaetaceae bacterium]
MEKDSWSFKKIALVFPVTVLLSLGISLYLEANMGSDTYTCFQQGLSFILGWSVGNVNLAMSIVIVGIFLFVDRSLIGPGTVILCFGIGPMISVFLWLFDKIFLGELKIWLSLLLIIFGVIFTSIGISTYLVLNQGVQPMDMIIISISKWINKSYGIAMYVFSAICLLLGWKLGGVIGIGTLVNLLLTGKTIDLMVPRIRKILRNMK